MDRVIKFRSVHLKHITNEFVCFKYWGRLDYKGNPDSKSFVSPSYVGGTYIAVDQQYTGLKDKNGKEIYEGDIVRFIDNGMLFIKMATYPFINIDSYHKNNIEIIGNIYETPQLLKTIK